MIQSIVSRTLLGLLIVTSASVHATSEIVRDPKAWDFAPLLYYDRVVRGKVISASLTEIGAADLTMDPPELRAQAGNPKITVVSVTMDIAEVLRGPGKVGNGTFLAVGDVGEALSVYLANSELLVCLKYHPLLKTYIQSSSYGIYMRVGQGWSSMMTGRGQRTFGDGDVRSKIASMELEQVASAAELVVKGEIQSIDTSEVVGPDGSTADMLTIWLKVLSIEKGAFDGELVPVKAIAGGMYLPSWRKHIPNSIAKGQRWLCFLQKNEVGWYPFAGSNGLLRITENGYIYDDRLPYWHSPEKVSAAIMQARGERTTRIRSSRRRRWRSR